MTNDEPDKPHYQALLSQGLSHQAPTQTPDISGYEIERLLGQGGMSKVYLARESALNRLVALKIFNANAIDAICVERFHQEAQMMAQIQHPNIVSIYGQISQGEEIPCLVLEYVPGGDLRSKLTQLGTLPLKEAAKIAIDVCSGLTAIHQKSIVHRDINPANVLLDEHGAAKVADLGIALNKQDSTTAESLTMTGTFVGTMAYLAPEQMSGSRHGIDTRADIWAVGILLFEMLVGTPPQALLVSDLLSDVPPAIKPILKKCLRRNPNDRYPDILALKNDLEKITTPRKALPYRWIALGTIVCAVLGAVLYQNSHSAKPSAPSQPPPQGPEATTPPWTNVLNDLPSPLRPLRGLWNIHHETLSCQPHATGAIIPLPLTAPGDNYDVSLTFTRKSGTNSIALFLPTSIGMINFDLDGWGKHLSGIQNIDGMDMRAHGKNFLFTVEKHRTYELLLEVRKESITVSINGKTYYQWDIKGHIGSLTGPWQIPMQNQLALGAWNSAIEFQKIKFRKHSP